ncbi:calcium-independent phospholipase A2-gamma-like isoform X3 [Hypomesus transpacificus]|uniref:calcium-independent phospholipase A2-gamma-like isoform X3 n=1 Tax=Hypomesus transpacificus TaxID=137520 RepID=UPI001F07F3C3|nr:calcium-independent phospholipase A2-gamma-like isoform X3 [Hypomesus transpacificus]
MGRYLNPSLCVSPLGGRTIRLYCKLRYIITILRTLPHLAKTPLSQDISANSLLSSPLHISAIRRGAPKTSRLKHRYLGIAPGHLFRNGSRGIQHTQALRYCSTSGRGAVKAEAPIGVYEESQTAFQLKRVSRAQRRVQSNRVARERSLMEDRDSTQITMCEESQRPSESSTEMGTKGQIYSGLQLFHPSSLATRFGESYTYVAHHINSMFSKGPALDVQMQETQNNLASHRGSTRRQRMRISMRSHNENMKGTEHAQLETSAAPVLTSTVDSDDVPSNWDEGYLHFSKHINRYFGAKVSDETEPKPQQREHTGVNRVPSRLTYQQQFSTHADPGNRTVPLEPKQKEHVLRPQSPGLFHASSISTSFGESYAQMANHVNQYFKGQGALKEEQEEGYRQQDEEMETKSAASQKQKAVSFMDCFRQPSSAIPYMLGGYLNKTAQTTTAHSEASINRRVVMSRNQAEEQTRALVGSLGHSLSPDALTTCIKELNRHLIKHPACKLVVWQEKTAVKLLRQRRCHRDNQDLQSVIRESLALIGYTDPVKGRGIRVLSIDGGGTRGVVPLQVLKQLEAETGKQVHQLFDYICGVSTGAVLAFMLGLARFSLEECEEMYRRFGSDVFRQNPLVGTMKMGWSHSYYSTETWEMILREKMGEKVLIKTARDELSPKVSAVSAVVNWGTSPKPFIFRNYNHSPGRLSRYAGGSGYQMWQAVRASSAAPGYFQEFPLHSDIHQDGGIILNNPCALAVHESRLLWPNQPFQCVLSLGTGRFDNAKRGPTTSTSLRAKISTLIYSATDTEGVHTLLDDLLAPDIYFRFNPMLSAEVSLDESRPGALDQLQADTQLYLGRNKPKLARLCLVLGAERTAVAQTKDWLSERAWEMKQSWV